MPARGTGACGPTTRLCGHSAHSVPGVFGAPLVAMAGAQVGRFANPFVVNQSSPYRLSTVAAKQQLPRLMGGWICGCGGQSAKCSVLCTQGSIPCTQGRSSMHTHAQQSRAAGPVLGDQHVAAARIGRRVVKGADAGEHAPRGVACGRAELWRQADAPLHRPIPVSGCGGDARRRCMLRRLLERSSQQASARGGGALHGWLVPRVTFPRHCGTPGRGQAVRQYGAQWHVRHYHLSHTTRNGTAVRSTRRCARTGVAHPAAVLTQLS
jgi:hypothetical protein